MKTFCYLIFFLAFEALITEGESNNFDKQPCQIPEHKLIDLTHPYDETTIGWPTVKKFQLTVTDNGTTKDGYWLQSENYESGIHTGTHMDAPSHMRPDGWSVHQIPVSYFIAPAAVVDITRRTGGNDPDSNLEVGDLINWEEETGRSLDGSIVLVRTGWDIKWNNPKAYIGTTSNNIKSIRFPGISPKAAKWLASNRNVYGVGIDTTSLDNGRVRHRKAHEALFAANIYGLENVANLYKLPPYGAQLYVFPMKITGASGAPVRIIAHVL